MTPTELALKLSLAAEVVPGAAEVFDEILATTGHGRECVEGVLVSGGNVYMLIGCCGSFFRLSTELGEGVEGGARETLEDLTMKLH